MGNVNTRKFLDLSEANNIYFGIAGEYIIPVVIDQLYILAMAHALEIVKNNKGGNKLIVDNVFTYTSKRKTKTTIRWEYLKR